MNPVVHFELPVEGDNAKKFYQQVFNWKLNEMPEMNYTIVHTTEVDDKQMPKIAGAINGGMLSIKDNGNLNPVLVISVDSVDDHINKIEKAGGKLLAPKSKVGDMGWYARFTDPSGVVMGIWETIKA